MNRRIFVILSFYILIKPLNAKKQTTSYWEVINSTLNHLFPKSKDLNLINFFKLVTSDKYFDKDDLKLLIKGANILYKMDNNYLHLTKIEKEKLLRKFEKNSTAQRWLSILMYYGFEAMFGDPIYGGNYKQKGWSSIKHKAGFPRPKNKYGKNHV